MLKTGLVGYGNEVMITCCKGANYIKIHNSNVRRILANKDFLNKSNLLRLWWSLFSEKFKLAITIKTFNPDVVLCLQLDRISVPTINYINSLRLPKVYRLGNEWIRIYFQERLLSWERFIEENASNQTKKKLLGVFCVLNKHFLPDIKKSELKADAIIYNSYYMKERNSPVIDENIKTIVIRNGVDTSKFKKRDRHSEDPNKLLYVGRIGKQKGTTILLESMNLIVNVYGYENMILTMVGSTDNEIELSNMHGLIIKYNLEKNVNILGVVPHEEIPDIYREHDIFVFPSIRRKPSKSQEGCPSVILEAMASGLPIVARLEPGIDEILENGKTCVGVYEDDPRLVAIAIIELSKNINLYNILRKKGLEKVQRNHSFYDMLNEYKRELKGAISNNQKKSIDIQI